MARYLVTGGAGFIGSALARRLIEAGNSVDVFDLPSKFEEFPCTEGARRIDGDVRRRDSIGALAGPYDAVLHLAAQTSARISHEEPEVDIDTNARGTLLLAQWCVERRVNRLLYASSMAVYGNPADPLVTEASPTQPVSFYGVTKLAGEHYLQAHVPLGLEPVVFRLFNVYGPGQDMNNLKQGMISIYLAYVARGQEIPVTGSLDRFRDFIYIDDVVDAWMLALARPARERVYNLGTGTSYTVRQAIDGIVRQWGSTTSRAQEVDGHPSDTFGIRADVTRFSTEFGWTPKVDFTEGLRRMVGWLKGGRAA